MKKITQEIISLNEELISFDSGDVNIEALEQRLELIVPDHGCIQFSCQIFRDCRGFSCGTYNP